MSLNDRLTADLKTAILNPSQPVVSNSDPAMFQGTNDNGNAVSMAPAENSENSDDVLSYSTTMRLKIIRNLENMHD